MYISSFFEYILSKGWWNTMQKVMLHLCFTLFIVLLLFVGVKIQFYLDTDAQVNFNVYPRLFYFTLFPLIVGILLRFLQSINHSMNKQNWSFQPDKFIAITVPTLFISFSPALLFSPVGEYLPYLTNIILVNTTFVTIISLIAGYSLLDCFIQKDKENSKEYN
ncbi:hypothetical protein DN408_30085 [Bacillus sp. AR13-1]|nr:hypothetical protein DN408_30085 [Bacillus sp. AR13-1]